jgi:hypothetical protein
MLFGGMRTEAPGLSPEIRTFLNQIFPLYLGFSERVVTIEHVATGEFLLGSWALQEHWVRHNEWLVDEVYPLRDLAGSG